MHEDARREVAVKILYTFDKEHNTTYLARLPKPLEVQVICADASGGVAHPSSGPIGVIDLRVCAVAMVAASPELVVVQSHDYALYVTDYTEADLPLVGHGMLSWILASNPDSKTNKVVGKIKSNYMALFSNASKETLEIKIRLQPVLQLLQSDFIKAMNAFAMLSRVCPPDYDPTAWVALYKSDPARVNSVLATLAASHSRSLVAAAGPAKPVQKGTRVYKPPRRTRPFIDGVDGPDSAAVDGYDQGLITRLSEGPRSEHHSSPSLLLASASPPDNSGDGGQTDEAPTIPASADPKDVIESSNACQGHAEAHEFPKARKTHKAPEAPQSYSAHNANESHKSHGAVEDDEPGLQDIRAVSSPRLPSIPPGPDPFLDDQEQRRAPRSGLLFPPKLSASMYSDDDNQTIVMPFSPTKRRRLDSDASTTRGEPAQKKARSLSPEDEKDVRRSKKSIEQQLKRDVKAGRVPAFCENCGSIRTVSWRRVVTTEGTTIPCGLFYTKQQRQRPKEFWGVEEVSQVERPWPKASTTDRPKKKRGRPFQTDGNYPAISRSSPPRRAVLADFPNNVAQSEPNIEYLVRSESGASKSGTNESSRVSKENMAPSGSPKASAKVGSPITPAKRKSGSFMEDLLKTPSRMSSALRNVCSPSPWRTGIFASAKPKNTSFDGQISPTRTIDSSNIEQELLSPQTRALTDLLQGTLDHDGFVSTDTMLPSSPPPFFTSGKIQSDAWSDLVTSPMSPSKSYRREEETIIVDFDAYYDVLNDDL